MTLSKQAKQNRPKKPLNTYMRFMKRRCEQLGDTENKKQIVNKQWKQIQDDEKDKLKKEVDDEMKVYQQEMQKWRTKYDITESQEKQKRSKSKKNKDDDQETKGEKSKGDKKKKQDKKEKEKKQEQKQKDKEKQKDKGKEKQKKQEKEDDKKGKNKNKK